MRVPLNGETYTIKTLSAADFLVNPHSVPFCIFEIDAKVKEGMYGQLLDGLDDDEPKPDCETLNDDRIRTITEVINIGLEGLKKEVSLDDVKLDQDKYTLIYGYIIHAQLKAFSSISRRKLCGYQLEFIGQMGEKYGKTPIEILFPNGGYSDLEGFLYNRATANYSNRQANKERN